MSTYQTPAPVNMTESSIIKHYKKQLIYRQHDVPEPIDDKKDTTVQLVAELSNTKIYDFVESEKQNRNKEKKTRRKRKNKNCRGQFRHEAMELIKLGTNPSHTLCKTKDPTIPPRIDKPPPEPPKPPRTPPQYHNESTKPPTVIQANFAHKSPLKPPPFGHALPQMVPERRNSKELHLPKAPPTYQSPPRGPPEYRVPVHPPYSFSHPPYPHHPLPLRPTPYPVRPIPQPPYAGIPFPYRHAQYSNGYRPPDTLTERHAQYNNGYHPPDAPTEYHPPDTPTEYPERKKRKHEDKDTPIVAAIDLTVDQRQYEKGGEKHKCQCDCGQSYGGGQVIVKVPRDSSQVPSSYMRGKMVNGVLKFDQDEANAKSGGQGAELRNGGVKSEPPATAKASKTPEPKLPQLFLIEDLLAKGVNIQKPPRIQQNGLTKPKIEDKTVPIRTEPNRVIVSTEPNRLSSETSRVIVSTRPPEEPRPRSKDHSVSTIISSDHRRRSIDVDTISISSSGSESVRSPRPKSTGVDKSQIPYGKLFYYKSNNSFIRYFDDTQKKLFIDNITADGQNYDRHSSEDKEIIELPRNAVFSSKDNLTVEEYVSEMTLVEKFIPRDFFLFYKFVTGYQICNNNLPVSFLTFLKVYNTNGLKDLLERYVNSLKQN